MSEALRSRILADFDGATARETADCAAVTFSLEGMLDSFQRLRDAYALPMLMDLCGVDWGVDRSPRFTVFYHLFSVRKHDYLRVAVDCRNDKAPEIPSVTSIWPAANWHEREAYDMFGIRFIGHPELKRILMWEEYLYFPLRKDFPVAGVETELPAPDVVETTGAKVQAAPMMGGPFVSPQKKTMRQREPRALSKGKGK